MIDTKVFNLESQPTVIPLFKKRTMVTKGWITHSDISRSHISTNKIQRLSAQNFRIKQQVSDLNRSLVREQFFKDRNLCDLTDLSSSQIAELFAKYMLYENRNEFYIKRLESFVKLKRLADVVEAELSYLLHLLEDSLQDIRSGLRRMIAFLFKNLDDYHAVARKTKLVFEGIIYRCLSYLSNQRKAMRTNSELIEQLNDYKTRTKLKIEDEELLDQITAALSASKTDFSSFISKEDFIIIIRLIFDLFNSD